MMYEVGDRVILSRQGAGIYSGYGQEYQIMSLAPHGIDTYGIENENHHWWCHEHQLDLVYDLPEVTPNFSGLDKLIGGV